MNRGRARALVLWVGSVAVVLAALVPPARVAAYMGVSGFAAVAPWIGTRWWRPSDRGPWTAIGVGLGLVFAGDLYYLVLSSWLLSSPEPVVSIADVAYLAGYVALGAGILSLSRRHRLDNDVDLVLDAAAVALGFSALVVPLVVMPALDAGMGGLETLVNLSYPIADAVLLGVVLRMALGPGRHTPAGILVMGGLACWLVGDLIYLSSIAGVASFDGALLDLVWMLAALALGAGALHPSMAELLDAAPAGAPSGRARVIVSLLSLAVVPVVILLDPEAASIPGSAFWVATVALLSVLLVWRVVRLFAARERAEADLARTVRYFRALAANSSDALLAVDRQGRITDGSPGLLALLGRADLEIGGAPVWRRVHPDDVSDSERRFAEALSRPGEVLDGEVRIIDFAGEQRWLSTRVVNLLEDPDVERVIINIDDLTARRAAEAELERQANSDALTGLENRVALRRRLRELAVPRDGGGRPYSMLLLDVDGFTQVNERFGHDAGDELLRCIGDRLRGMTRSGDTVARIGGDEFAVLIEHGRPDGEEPVAFANRIVADLREPFDIDGETFVVGVSIGIAVRSVGGDHELVLRDAVVAVQEAKAAGRGRIVVFEESMRQAAADRLQLETDLTGATARGEMALHYQPIYELDPERVVGFEALLRWTHPVLGPVGPDRFVPVAESTGDIVPIGAWVIDEACATLAPLRERHPDLHVSVNVSARQLADGNLVPTVHEALRAHGLPASALTVEITETALVDDPESAASSLAELKELGVRIAIDDFGTGYSSLSYLRQFPVDVLKIDRSFVAQIDESGVAPPIVRGVLELARTLGLMTVAEGIEEEFQRELLRAEGCELAQGYLFSRPVAVDQVRALLDDPCERRLG